MNIEFRIYDKETKEDITDKETWVITPEGKLYFIDYDSLTGDLTAEVKYIINGNLSEEYVDFVLWHAMNSYGMHKEIENIMDGEFQKQNAIDWLEL